MKIMNLVCVGGMLLTTACHDKITCGGVGLARVPPTDVTLSVGSSVQLRYETGGTCDPSHVTDADFHEVPLTWSTADTATVQLEPSTGRVTGLRTGTAVVTGRAPDVTFIVQVHVS